MTSFCLWSSLKNARLLTYERLLSQTLVYCKGRVSVTTRVSFSLPSPVTSASCLAAFLFKSSFDLRSASAHTDRLCVLFLPPLFVLFLFPPPINSRVTRRFVCKPSCYSLSQMYVDIFENKHMGACRYVHGTLDIFRDPSPPIAIDDHHRNSYMDML